jgi:prepilin-type N-terminal cleavage/methylation domain-containing protein
MVKRGRTRYEICHCASGVARRASSVVRRSSLDGQRGFSLIELLLAVTILVIAIVPLMDSITASFQYARAGKENTILFNYARQKMEDVLALSFDSVPISASPGTPIALSDTVTITGKTVNRLVLVDLYDGNGDSVPDSDLKKVTVIVQGVQYDTLMANHY